MYLVLERRKIKERLDVFESSKFRVNKVYDVKNIVRLWWKFRRMMCGRYLVCCLVNVLVEIIVIIGKGCWIYICFVNDYYEVSIILF